MMAALASAALISTSATVSAAPASSATALLLVQVNVPGGWLTSVNLTCGPAGGAHPKPASACALLTDVDGDLARYPGEEGVCTKEYLPHEVSLTGRWAGRPVRFEKTFANQCELFLATGAVFDV